MRHCDGVRYDFVSDTFTANDGNGRNNDARDSGDCQDPGACGPHDPFDLSPSTWHGAAGEAET